MIPFAEWLPDIPDLNNPGATVANNVLPGRASYKPLLGLGAQDSTLDAFARGAIAARDKTGSTFNYAGDGTKLYQLTPTGTTDVSRTTPAYDISADELWKFTKFGEKIIAVNIDDEPQVITLGGANFADLTGSPPQARYICTIGRQDSFVVVGNVNDVGGDGLVPNRVQWSAAGNETGWTTGTDLAGQQDLQGNGGWVQGVCGGEFGLVFQERSIWRMDFVGAPDVFSFAEIEAGRGTPAPGSIANFGNTFFYLGQDGIYAHNGVASGPIGANKVNKTFFNQLDESNILRISSTIDPVNNFYIMAYPTQASKGNGDPDKLLIYDFVNDRFSEADVDLELIYSALSFDVGLDTEPLASSNIDTLTVSLDSRQWVGNALLLAAFNRFHNLAYFNGDALAATVETGEINGNRNGTSLLTAARPLVDGATASNITVQAGSRQLQTDANSFGAAEALNSRGEADFRVDARYHRIRVNIASDNDWTDALGVDPQFVPTGLR